MEECTSSHVSVTPGITVAYLSLRCTKSKNWLRFCHLLASKLIGNLKYYHVTIVKLPYASKVALLSHDHAKKLSSSWHEISGLSSKAARWLNSWWRPWEWGFLHMPGWHNNILMFTIINSPLINFPNYARLYRCCISEQQAGKRKMRRRKRGRRERRRKGRWKDHSHPQFSWGGADEEDFPVGVEGHAWWTKWKPMGTVLDGEKNI